MALADIVKRIEGDAQSEAAGIIAAAEERAAAIIAAAEAKAAESRDASMADARLAADREASRVVVTAKLTARDATLTARRKVVDEALEATAERLASLPDAEYARFLAARISATARGGETVRLGSADLARKDAVARELASLESGIVIADEPAPFERGALVEGSRVRADLSLSAIVDERRDDLELAVASVLFGTEA